MLLLALFIFISLIPHDSSTSIHLSLPPSSTSIIGKCGINEYFFRGKECPWKTLKTRKIAVNGVIRLGTIPESCFYDDKRYKLKYKKNGDQKSSSQTLTDTKEGTALLRNPQCHIGISIFVAQFQFEVFNDPRASGFQADKQPENANGNNEDKEQILINDQELSHHMDNTHLHKVIEQTKNDNSFVFVKPKHWKEIDSRDNNKDEINVIIRPSPVDFQHLPQNLDDISQFEDLIENRDENRDENILCSCLSICNTA